MGVVMAAIIVVGVVGAYLGTRGAPVGRVEPGAGTLRDQLRIVAAARDFRLLLTTYVVQALATGCMLAGVDYLAEDVLDRSGATTILFVCFVGPALAADARVGGARRADRQAARATSLSSAVLALGALVAVDGAVGAGRGRLRCGGSRRLSATPAARSSRWRCCPTRRRSTRGVRVQPGRRLHRRVDRGRDVRAGARAGAVRAGAGDRRLPVVDRPATWCSRTAR